MNNIVNQITSYMGLRFLFVKDKKVEPTEKQTKKKNWATAILKM